MKKLLNIFSYYLKFSGLKPNFSKCEIGGIGSLKGVCGVKCVNLRVNTSRFSEFIFHTIINLTWKKNFLTAISNTQSVLKIWRMRNLTLEGKTIVFKTLALSKIVHLCFTSVVPKQIIEEIENIQKNFLWNQ